MGHAVTAANVGAELILDLIVRGFPSPTEHPAADRDRHRRQPRRAARPPIPTDRCARRSSRPRAIPTSARSPSSASSRGRCAVTPSCTCRGTSATAPATRTTTSTSASATSPACSAASTRRRPPRSRERWSRSASSPGRRPATPSPRPSSPLLMEPWHMPVPLLPGCDHRQERRRRGQARERPRPRHGGGSDTAGRASRGDRPDPAVDPRRGPCRPRPRSDPHPLRRRGDVDRGSGLAPRDLRRTGRRQRPPRQAVRRPRPVRGLRHHGRAAPPGLRDSSSSTRSSAVPSPARSSRRSRRASATR